MRVGLRRIPPALADREGQARPAPFPEQPHLICPALRPRSEAAAWAAGPVPWCCRPRSHPRPGTHRPSGPALRRRRENAPACHLQLHCRNHEDAPPAARPAAQRQPWPALATKDQGGSVHSAAGGTAGEPLKATARRRHRCDKTGLGTGPGGASGCTEAPESSQGHRSCSHPGRETRAGQVRGGAALSAGGPEMGDARAEVFARGLPGLPSLGIPTGRTQTQTPSPPP